MDIVVQIHRVILVDDEDESCCYCDCQFFHDPWPNECYCLIEGYGDGQEIQLTKQGEKWKRTQACLESGGVEMISDLNFNMTFEELQRLRNLGYHVEVFLTFKDCDLLCPKCQKEHYEKEKILKYKFEDKTYRFWCIECGTYWEATPKHRYSVIPPMWKGDIVE